MSHTLKIGSILLLLAAGEVRGQSSSDLIAASQTAASPLFFEPAPGTPLVQPGTFANDKECTPRNGLPAFFKKAAAGKPLLVAFIGGSITQGNAGYRPQTLRYLQAMYPGVNIRALNAGVSGTGTDLGACRLKEQVLQHRPDLVFVEFAVNGAYAEGMEGIVRQVKQSGAEVCLIYTILGAHTKIYAAGGMPDNIKGLEKIAAHYAVPSMHLGMEAALLEQEGKLRWKGDNKDTTSHILFSNDGVHPLQAGGNLYAAAVARGLEKMKSLPGNAGGSLPAAVFATNWADAGMYVPREVARFSPGWEQVTLPQFAPWFPQMEKAVMPGASFTFRFRGTGFGIFDVGGPEAGQITLTVNGKPMQVQPPLVQGTQVYRLVEGDSLPVNRFNMYCNNRYRGQHQLFVLPEGEYTVTVRLSSQKADKRAILGAGQLNDIQEHPEKYDQQVLYLGRVLIKGTPLLNGNR